VIATVEPVESPCVCATLRMATRAVARVYDGALEPHGLRTTQYSILSRLAVEGPAPVGRLAARLIAIMERLRQHTHLCQEPGQGLPTDIGPIKTVLCPIGAIFGKDPALRIESHLLRRQYALSGGVGELLQQVLDTCELLGIDLDPASDRHIMSHVTPPTL